MNLKNAYFFCGYKKPRKIFEKPLDKTKVLVYNNHVIDFRDSIFESEGIKLTHQDYNELQSLYEKEGQATVSTIANVLYGSNYIDRSTVIAASYVLLMANNDATSVKALMHFVRRSKQTMIARPFLKVTFGIHGKW